MANEIKVPELTADNVLRCVVLPGDHKLLTWQTGKFAKTGQNLVGYAFYKNKTDEKPLFVGEDFGCPPSYYVDSDKSIVELLSFLTLAPGDTESDYFADYTSEQLEWATSAECEELKYIVLDAECDDVEEPFLTWVEGNDDDRLYYVKAQKPVFEDLTEYEGW